MEIQFELLDLVLVSPVIALFLASLVPLTIKVLRGNREPNPFVTLSYGFLGLVGAAIGVMFAHGGAAQTAFGRALVFDGMSSFGALVVLFTAGLSLVFARESLATNNRHFSEFVFLFLNAIIGMLTVIWANDLIVLFIGIELMSLALYVMIALSSEERLSKEAAFKYFILGSFASAIMLYGVAFIYGTVGSTYLPDITQSAIALMATNRLFLFGVVLAFVGLCFKVSIFPFHAWTPDVYQGSPTALTAFMATGVKAATLVFFLRFMGTEVLMAERSISMVNAMQWLAVFTMVAGNIAALLQNNLKRMLAYSSVAHSGYVLIGLVAAGLGGPAAFAGATSVAYYIFAYSVMTVGAFGVLCLFEHKAETSVNVEDLRGLASRSPWIALCIAIFMLSLAGIPPTIGFFGKFFIFSAAVQQGLIWMAVWGVLSSVISVYYYLRPVVVMYMQEEAGASVLHTRQLTHMAVSISAVLVIGLGLVTEPFYKVVVESIRHLF